MEDQTIGPILSWTTEAMLGHVEKLQKIPGASLAFGGKRLEGHTIPERYGAIVPTAVFVPLKEILKPENFELVTTEVFGPVQVSSEAHGHDLLVKHWIWLEKCLKYEMMAESGRGITVGNAVCCLQSQPLMKILFGRTMLAGHHRVRRRRN